MIGVIVRTDQEVAELSKNWEPDSIDIPSLIGAFKQSIGYQPESEEFCHDEDGVLIYFTVDSFIDPKSITFNCTFNEIESAIIRSISKQIDAKIYDSEACDFI